jgi:hypothetical protein
MKDSFKFTLYEVFGYFLPGLVLAVALVLLFWSLFHAGYPLELLVWKPKEVHWFLIVIACYTLGHLSQAIGNLLFPRRDDEPFRAGGDSRSALISAAQVKASEQLGCQPGDLSPTWLYRYMDEYVIQHGEQGDREVFTYREGFYRGTAISLLMLAFSVIIRLCRPHPAIQLPTYVYAVSFWQLAYVLTVVLAGAYLMYRRFQRFSEHRINRVLLSFLALNGMGAKEG